MASGGTAASLEEWGVAHRSVESVTGAPEMLSGRVKTLHPAIHGGILADRSNPEHLADLSEREITPIDLVVCNLYPFSSDPSVEMIDIGGPAMVRAAAKNHAHVGVVVDPYDYAAVLEELSSSGLLGEETRRTLAAKAFKLTSEYDAAVASWLESLSSASGAVASASGAGGQPGSAVASAGGAGDLPAVVLTGEPASLPAELDIVASRVDVLHYGENPHQAGARYRISGKRSVWDRARVLAGRGLSYLNLYDADAAWSLLHEVRDMASRYGSGSSAAVIVKHANPCGVAVASSPLEAYELALAADPVSAFGGIVALHVAVDLTLAEALAKGPQADVIVASGFTEEAVARLVARRKATRLVELPEAEPATVHLRSLGNALLLQEADRVSLEREGWTVVTKAVPDESLWRDMALAWLVAARTSSNAIVLACEGQVVGVGAGQQNRVDASRIATAKAGGRAEGGAGASDAFFPFRDGLDALVESGVRGVIQPGGSIRDAEVIAAADERAIAMVFTGERHFRH